ncbi:MAG: TIGR01244 family sulfur transferase [Hyphomicrobium sp.]
MSLPRAFFLAIAAGMMAMVGYAMMTKMPAGGVEKATGHALLNGVFVTEQVALAAVGNLPKDGYRTLIDLRPDGEAADQPPSAAVGDAARAAGLTFAYYPTPKTDIPDSVVDGVVQTLATAPGPVIMYCRSGSRAARVWALAEASRAGGASAGEIAAAVRTAGQSVDDLASRIAARIAARKAQSTPKAPS